MTLLASLRRLGAQAAAAAGAAAAVAGLAVRCEADDKARVGNRCSRVWAFRVSDCTLEFESRTVVMRPIKSTYRTSPQPENFRIWACG